MPPKKKAQTSANDPPRKRGRPSKKAAQAKNDPPICNADPSSTLAVSTQVKVSTSDGNATCMTSTCMTSTLLSPTKIVITTTTTSNSQVRQPTPGTSKNLHHQGNKEKNEENAVKPKSNVIVISDDEDEPPVAGTSAANTAHQPSSFKSGRDPSKEDEEDVCPICLDKPVHPVKLECGHEFCYLCAKGLTSNDEDDDAVQSYVTQYGPGGVVIQIPIPRAARGHGGPPVGSCSMCRAPIQRGYLKRPEILTRTRSDLEGATRGPGEKKQINIFDLGLFFP